MSFFNLILIRGFGPIPAFRTAGAAMGTCTASGLLAIYALSKLIRGGWVVSFPRGDRSAFAPDWTIIKSLFRFGLPTGIQGIAMNVGGVFLLSFIGSVAQSRRGSAAFSVSYSQLFSFITWTSVGLMGAAAAVAGQNLGAGKPDRANEAVHVAAAYRSHRSSVRGSLFLFLPAAAARGVRHERAVVVEIGTQLLRVLSVSGLFIAVALTYTGGLQGTGDTKSPLYISIVSQIVVPLGICFFIQQTATLQPLAHLDCNSHRARDSLPVERAAVQPGQVARHRGRHRAAGGIIAHNSACVVRVRAFVFTGRPAAFPRGRFKSAACA
jgi:Na+-driven multidrug efflux pump